MKRALSVLAALSVAAIGLGSIERATAAEPAAKESATTVGSYKTTAARLKKRQGLYGVVRKRGGGYSYSAASSANTYGGSRTLYGGNQVYWDWHYGRQTAAGPFDHGFTYDSSIQTSGAQRGGDSPYMH